MNAIIHVNNVLVKDLINVQNGKIIFTKLINYLISYAERLLFKYNNTN